MELNVHGHQAVHSPCSVEVKAARVRGVWWAQTCRSTPSPGGTAAGPRGPRGAPLQSEEKHNKEDEWTQRTRTGWMLQGAAREKLMVLTSLFKWQCGFKRDWKHLNTAIWFIFNTHAMSVALSVALIDSDPTATYSHNLHEWAVWATRKRVFIINTNVFRKPELTYPIHVSTSKWKLKVAPNWFLLSPRKCNRKWLLN